MNRVFEIIVHEISESLRMAITSIRTNKLRSILTLLGIAVGVFSIIGVMTAMGVMINSIEGGMTILGANTFQIQQFPTFQTGDPREWAKLRNRKKITYEQAIRVKENASLANAVGIFCFAEEGKVVASAEGKKTNPNVNISGRDIEGFMANNWEIENGRVFSQSELDNGNFVTVVGIDVVKKLYPKTDPINQVIKVDGRKYKVVGVVQSRGQMLGMGNESYLVIPLNTFFSVYGKDYPFSIKVQSKNAESFDDCLEQVRGVLRTARHVDPGADDDFSIWSNDSLITQFNEFTKYLRLGIIIVSGIALLAAGVGIMNIMLVSVTERTREIGIRKAIGARKSHIMAQFVIEAVLLSEIGGLIGIAIGVIAGNLVALLMDVNPVIPMDWVAIGFVTCSLVGIIFGVYPALKAANLDPIESLRYE
jgi:putative ABC transport system permease protein